MDHNMDLLKHDQILQMQIFFETMLHNFIMSCITRPTRITKDTATLIDNICLLRELHAKQLSGILISDLSDHLPCLSIISNCKGIPKEIFQTKRKLNKKNIDLITMRLTEVDWNELLANKDVNDGTKLFHQKLLNILDEIAPEQSEVIPIKKVIGQPWMTKGLLKCAKKQLILYKTALSSKSHEDQERYKQYCNILKKAKWASRESFYVGQCYELKSNTKKLWTMINTITGKVNDKSSVIPKISVGNIEYTDAKKISDILGNQFANIGKNYAEKLKGDVPIKSYLDKIGRNKKSIYFYPTNPTEISRIIDNLPNKKSSGWDDLYI